MPSATAALDFMNGVPGSLVHLLVSYLGRTAIVAGAMAAAGKRQHLWRDAAAGTAVIEAVVLLYFSSPEHRKSADIFTQTNIAAFLRGHPQYFLPILADIALRAGEIGTGMYLAGERKRNVKYALAGSVGVELFVLLYSIFFGKECTVPVTPPGRMLPRSTVLTAGEAILPQPR